jgi:hypothetical protein
MTLSRAERGDRANVTKEEILRRVQQCFQCRVIVIAKERHKEEGCYHYHVAFWNTNANKQTATRIIRNAFPDFETRL